ncbi:MAG TPA: GAF domain-containing protein [Anaeromyxobacter sp.]
MTRSEGGAGKARSASGTPGGGRRLHDGTMILRDGVIVFASDGLASLVGLPAAELVGRPWIDLLIPEDRERLLDLRERRRRGETTPRLLELTVLHPDGTRRSVEGHIDYDGRDTIVHVRDLAVDAERRQLLEAVAAIGVIVRTERSEEDVLARVRDEMGRLGAVSALLRLVDGRSRIVWVTAPASIRAEFEKIAGAAPEGFSGPASEFAHRVVEDGAAFTDDWASAASHYLPLDMGADARNLVHRGGFGRSIGVRIDRAADPGLYLVLASQLLRGEDVPAFRLFGAQLSAALEVARTISDLSRRNAHLSVLAQIAALACEATDLSSLFARASELLRPVAGCAGLGVFVADEAAGELVGLHYDQAGALDLDARSRRVPLASPLGEVVRTRLPRATAVPYPGGDPAAAEMLRTQALAWIPLVSRSRGVGVLTAGFEEGGLAAAEASLELLTAAGAHFASAIAARGLLSDLRRHVGELTLLVDVARASAQLDPVLLLEAALPRVATTLGAEVAAAYLREDDRLRLLSSVGLDPEAAGAVADLGASDGAVGAALSWRGAVHATTRTAFGPTPPPGRCAAMGPALAVPLIAKNEAVGALLLARGPEAGAFAQGEVSLLTSIGAQLGLALDAARLFASQRRRLSDFEAVQALTLRVFANAPGELGSLLQDACREIARALGAPTTAVFLLEPGGSRLVPAASVGMPPGFEAVTIDVGQDGITSEAMRTRAPQQTPDLTADPRSQLAGRADLGALSALIVPLASRRDVEGVVYVADRPGRRFGAEEMSVASALAGALGLALENAALYADSRRRADQLALLHEVGRSLVETLDLQQILNAGVQNLARIVDAPDVYLCLLSEDGASLVLRAVAGSRQHLRGMVLPSHPADHNLASRVAASHEPLVVEDAQTSPSVRPELVELTGGRAFLALPLIVRERTIGALVIVDPVAPRHFTPAEMERAAAVANQLAVAADNARLYEDLRRSYSDLARAQQALVHRERLAALGELSAVVAHEVRNPLGVIFNSLGSLRRLVHPTGDARTLFRIIEEEAERLNRIVGDLLDFARPSTPDLQPESLARVAEEAVASVLAQQEARIELLRELDPALPEVAVDARLVRQAVVNVAVNAAQAMARGGRITVRTLRDGDAAVVELEDDGPGIPEEVRGRIFEPFFTTKATGTGLGLAVVRRIVEGHGGTVAVRPAREVGTVFALRFPLSPGPVADGPGSRRESAP